MPALDNPKHERFAQLLAKGKTADEAYTLAGYKQNRHNAATLGREQHISTRVAEIQEFAAKRVEISVASVTESLLRIARKAEDLAEASGLSVARAAHMDAAKLNGLVIEKTDNTNRGPVNLSDDDLAAIAIGSRATPSGETQSTH